MLKEDQSLIAELKEGLAKVECVEVEGLSYRNSTLAGWVKEGLPLAELFKNLATEGAFDFDIEVIDWVDTDGERRELSVNRASRTSMWPMGTHYWVRDNTIIGARLMEVNRDLEWCRATWFEQGKALLLSALSVMSSCRQLERFESLISGESDRTDPHAWPHIFLHLEENLTAEREEAWMHKQDAWQMTCYYVLDAIERGWITREELTAKQRKLLELVVPFLRAVDYSRCENGGSWEEIAAVRASVISWEVALLEKLASAQWLDVDRGEIQDLLSEGRDQLARSLPYESGQYPADDVRYRKADATLLYAVMVDVLEHLGKVCAKQKRDHTLEVIGVVESLVGKHGVRRYRGDSYQGLSYYTNAISQRLSALYESPSGDSSGEEQFRRRGELVPSGHEAQWTHVIWQLSWTYGRLYVECGEKRFREKQEEYFHKGLSLFTGYDEVSLRLENGVSEVFSLPAFRLPECYNSEIYQDEVFVYPSLHTPLYWSIAEAICAFAQMEETRSRR